MKHIFTFKSVLIALLVMIGCTMKAETVEYTVVGGFTYSLDTETQEAALKKYNGYRKKVIIPEFVTYEGERYKVTSFGDYCFYGCSFKSVEVPASVVNLGQACFRACSKLTSIEIPASVKSLGQACFWDCHSLKTVVCKMAPEMRKKFLFDTTLIADATLYVPERMLDAYKSTFPWRYFGTILPLTEEQKQGVM